MKPVPITGVSACNSVGMSIPEVREALFEGRSALGPSPIDVPFETRVGSLPAEPTDLPAELSAWETRTAQIAQALLAQMESELARLRARWSPSRIAIVLGTSTAGADETESAYRTFLQRGALPERYDLWRHHTYGAILHVVRELTGAEGPAWVISTACTSSAKPFASAHRLIASGLADAAIVGGIDTLCAMTLRGFHSLGALSSDACRPFAEGRDGLNIGEGGALLLLERDGDAVALLESVGESSDAYHISAPHPEGHGAFSAMTRALELAGCSASDVDHINAHGTGTVLNDSAEAKAIERLFGAEVPVVSTKGYIGHTLGGAGASEAAIAIVTIEEGWVPASVGAFPRDPKISLNIPKERVGGRVRRVMSNSFAFGGNNVSILLRAA